MSTTNPAPLRAILLGQSPIKHDLRSLNPARYRQLAAQLDGADVCFPDLEGIPDDGKGEYAEFTA